MSEILEEDLEKQYQSELRVRDIRKKTKYFEGREDIDDLSNWPILIFILISFAFSLGAIGVWFLLMVSQ